VKKSVFVDKRAVRELSAFPRSVQIKFQALFEILEEKGKLEEPFGKKLSGTHLFEIRVRYQGQWRAIYAYIGMDKIVILCAFSKKTQKTPESELEKAIKRSIQYKEDI